MKNFILSILLLSTIYNLGKSDCASPSRYVLQLLANSTTLYRGSTEWINDIQRQNSKVNTIFGSEGSTRVSGITARVFRFAVQNIKADHDNITARFDITNDSNTISITSEIEENLVTKVENEEQIRQALSMNGKSENQSDLMTECYYRTETNFDVKEKALRAKVHSSCKSKLPVALFMQQMNKLRRS